MYFQKLLSLFISGLLLIHGGLYARAGVVVSTDEKTDLVTIQDFSGNVWEWYGVEDWERGDLAAMLMYDNGTDKIIDDQIISINYQGTI